MALFLRRADGYQRAMADVSLPAAAGAGVLSFLSPCVLPLVPPYLSYLVGETIDEMKAGERHVSRRAVTAALAFVFGFSTVFVLLGATASALGQVIRQHIEMLGTLAGVLIIVMGLHFLGLFRIKLLYREARVQIDKPAGLWGAYLMGLAFAFGWTPCIGPILAAILSVAGSEATVGRGALLLGVYSAGLGIPFLIAAFAMGPFMQAAAKVKARFALIEKAMGAMLVLTGIAFLTGTFSSVSFWLLETFPVLQKLG